MSKYFSILLAACLTLIPFASYSAAYSYSMKITASKPKGSAADAVGKQKNLPTSTSYTPCTTDKLDALSFKMVYNAGKAYLDATAPTQDVYLFFYNPNALGASADNAANPDNPFSPPCKDANDLPVPCDPKIWALVRTAYGFNQITMIPLADVSDIDPVKHIYLSAFENLGGTVTDILLRSYVSFDDLHSGIWGLVGIVADSAATPDFADQSTWTAWDVETFVVGAPWTDDLNPVACDK
ncbi:hypothetical protein [Thiocystis violacea]|uniref:hypothetical protein n=1 Tax=Thiocystis violacea TaxID=13725 RepID=UPI0019086B44|nr:hypothetical protein [Thiocystis violacea]MBK1717888.1 hypothetical protein [Thiocystis violacea]